MTVQVQRTFKRIVKMRYEDGVLKVVANWFVSRKRLRQLIEQNAEWIRQRKKEAAAAVSATKEQANQPAQHKSTPRQSSKPKPPTLRESISCGKKTLLMGDVITVVPTPLHKTYLEGNVLYINEKNYLNRDTRVKAIMAFLKKMAQLYVSNEIANFGSSVALCPAGIEFRKQEGRWVDCSQAAKRVLCFDPRIIQLPSSLRTYLIAHAFAHFNHPLHDEGFWNFVANNVPDYTKCAQKLTKFANEIKL